MNAFDDFSNYEELLKSLLYKDLIQLCRTNRKFRDICNSSRGKQIIKEVFEKSINDFVNRHSDHHIGDMLAREVDRSRLSKIGSKERIQQLIDEYEDITTDVVIRLLIRNNYSPLFYQRMIKDIQENNRIEEDRFQIETRYIPAINNLITTLYRYQFAYAGSYIMTKILDYDLQAYNNMSYEQIHKDIDFEFLKRHPTLLGYFRETYE